MSDKQKAISEESPAWHQCCCHHWIIETGTGPISTGVCKFCGEHKKFENKVRICSLKSETDGNVGLVKRSVLEPSAARRRNREEFHQAIPAVPQGQVLDRWSGYIRRLRESEGTTALGWHSKGRPATKRNATRGS